MFSLICVWTNGWTNNRDAWNLRRHGAHYGITVMLQWTVPGGTLPLESIASGYRLTNDQLHHAKHIRIYSTSQELRTWIALCRVLSWFGSASFFFISLKVSSYACHSAIEATRKLSWRRQQMETFSALLALCAGHSPVTGEFPAQRPVTRNFDIFFDLCLNKRLSKQSWGWWFETPSRPLWRHYNVRFWNDHWWCV